MNIDMNTKQLLVEYFTVPRIQESWKADAALFDSFKLDLLNSKFIS